MDFAGDRLELRPAVHGHLAAVVSGELDGRTGATSRKSGPRAPVRAWCCTTGATTLSHRSRADSLFGGPPTGPLTNVTAQIRSKLPGPDGLLEAGFRVATDRVLDSCESCGGLVGVVPPFPECFGELHLSFPKSSEVALFDRELWRHDIEDVFVTGTFGFGEPVTCQPAVVPAGGERRPGLLDERSGFDDARFEMPDTGRGLIKLARSVSESAWCKPETSPIPIAFGHETPERLNRQHLTANGRLHGGLLLPCRVWATQHGVLGDVDSLLLFDLNGTSDRWPFGPIA